MSLVLAIPVIEVSELEKRHNGQTGEEDEHALHQHETRLHQQGIV